MRERRRPPNDDARFIMEEDKPVLQKQEAIRLLFLRSKKCDWGTSRTTFPSSTEEKNATSGESAAVPCRARRPRRAAQQHQRRAVTSGQSAAFHCRGRRPRRPRSSTKVKFPRPACHRGRFSLTTFSHGKRKTCHPAPSPPPPPAHSRVFCRRLFLANSPRIRYNIPASGRGRGCPLFVFRSSASLRARRGGGVSLSHRSVISYV